MALPRDPVVREDILADLLARKAGDVPWKTGRAWAYVYDPGEAVDATAKEAYRLFLTENGLDPTSFPSLLGLEREVVGTVAAHCGGGPETVGTFTSGGTESILLAVKAAREFARERGISDPEIILPVTAHAAFHKAAQYLGLRVVPTSVEPGTFRADAAAMEDAITPSSALLVASAPSYAHGVVDPVRAIAALGDKRGIPVHVDACVGGWMLPYFRRLGADVPAFDLSVPGVTSLSVDLHKYAFAPKGASVVLFRDAAMRARATFACASWTGYAIVNPGVQSSKTGGPLAGAYATLRALGDSGYARLAATMFDATARLVAGVGRIPGLRVLGRPDMNLVALAAEGVDVFDVVDEVNGRGWYVQPQLAFDASPANIHLCVNPACAPWVDALLDDLSAGVTAARSLPAGPDLHAALGGADLGALDDGTLRTLLGAVGLGGSGGALPARMAPIHRLMNGVSPRVRERLLRVFVGELFR